MINDLPIKIIFLFLLSLSVIQDLQSQDIQYARNVIDTLCSPRYHGRGYVEKGEAKAARFIANEFKKIGLQKYETDYFQSFNVSVNTLPNQLILTINDIELTAGIDYQIAPSTPSVNNELKPLSLNVKLLSNWEKLKKKLKKREKYVLIIDNEEIKSLDKPTSKTIHQNIRKLQFSGDIKLGGIALISNQKLTWHSSQQQALRPYIMVNKNALKGKMESLKLNVEADFQADYPTQNVIGYIQGENDSIVVLSAHYDHLGRMGIDTYYPGANDNASGTALLLDLALQYSTEKPNYTMVFMAFGAEELGLLGSSYFVQNPLFSLSKIKFMLNFDIAGTGDDGIQVVNGSVFKSPFEKLQSLNEKHSLLPKVKIRGESCNSDHCPFYLSGVPSFFIYTLGGIQAYHDVYDKAETLPLTEYENYFKLITLFVDGL